MTITSSARRTPRPITLGLTAMETLSFEMLTQHRVFCPEVDDQRPASRPSTRLGTRMGQKRRVGRGLAASGRRHAEW